MRDMDSLILQLKQQPVFKETPVLALECTWEKLLQEVDELLSQLGFESFTYSVITRNKIGTSVDVEKHRWESGVEIVGSLPDSVVRTYYRDIAHHDPLWEVLPTITDPLVSSDLAAGQSAFAETFWQKQGVASRVYIPMKGASDNYWFHYFGLFHGLQGADFKAFFDNISEWLLPILNRYHALLQVVSEKEQNPYLRKEVLSSTCLQIMHMTAHGMPVKRIADKLALTEEGITYHITRAKRVFGARNKTQLIAMMYEVGLFK